MMNKYIWSSRISNKERLKQVEVYYENIQKLAHGL
jgi:hypothetical protein